MAETPAGLTEADLQALPLRRVLELSQTNVTADPELGFRYAVHAYERGLGDSIDRTAAGEAAAKATLRAAQADHPLLELKTWAVNSFNALPLDVPGASRERIATYTNASRAFALRALQGTLGHTKHTAERMTECRSWANRGFRRGEQEIQNQHQGFWWDPYATMHARHRATHEAVSGRAGEAARIALSGINRALRSRPEAANSPAGVMKHLRFVGKQAVSNALALGLALSRPLDALERGKTARQRLAHQWLN